MTEPGPVAVPFDVVVLGSLHLDVMVEAPDRPRKGETLVGRGWSLKAGGKGGNQAVEAARHGASVAMIGAVGADDFGARLLANLAANRVDARHVATVAEAGSGMSVAITDPSGDYGAVIVSGANLLLDESAVVRAAATITSAPWLVLQNEVPDAANVAAARLARSANRRVILNAAPARAMPPELAGLVDILVLNAIEAEMLSGTNVTDVASAEAAARHLSKCAAHVIVTAGAGGLCIVGTDGTAVRFSAHPVTVVSTHGAGDAFVGALATRLAAGDTLPAAARYANAAAALLVATPPGRRSALGPAAVMSMLASTHLT